MPTTTLERTANGGSQTNQPPLTDAERAQLDPHILSIAESYLGDSWRQLDGSYRVGAVLEWLLSRTPDG
jgi:hypothetical protein